MGIQVIAELLSALAAFVTVGMACIELYSRGSTKKAEVAIDVYAEYLFIVQRLQYSVIGVEKLMNNLENLTSTEIKAFAQTHILEKDLISKIQKIENSSIRNTNFSKKEGKINSRKILDFTGNAINLIITINTFYSMIVEGNEIPIERIEENAKRVQNNYQIMHETSESAGELLNNNLRKLHNNSNLYILLLFILSAMFVALCILQKN